jgi:hypothetical protein
VLCGGACPGIRKIDASCAACGAEPFDTSSKIMIINGEEMVIRPTFAGAEGRYEDYIYLQMLQREWERPTAEFERFSHFADSERPSGRAALVLLFWGYFETRIERLHRTAMRARPKRVLDDQLRRYSGIGSRLCLSKIKSEHIRGAIRRGLGGKEYALPSSRCAIGARPYPRPSACASHYSSERKISESGADVPRLRR